MQKLLFKPSDLNLQAKHVLSRSASDFQFENVLGGHSKRRSSLKCFPDQLPYGDERSMANGLPQQFMRRGVRHPFHQSLGYPFYPCMLCRRELA